MLELWNLILVKQVSLCIAPIFFHASEDSLLVLMCGLLIEFVDSYSSYILLILFIISLVMVKNLLMKVFTPKEALGRVPSNFTLVKEALGKLFL
jgi:hypothetical protein